MPGWFETQRVEINRDDTRAVPRRIGVILRSKRDCENAATPDPRGGQFVICVAGLGQHQRTKIFLGLQQRGDDPAGA